MSHQVPHLVPVQDDADVEGHLSSPGLGKSPLTLSFINNVQSAVAQIEHRLATSPSAHPPPPSRHELPQTPPGPTDPIIDRVEFLESSLSIPSPKTAKPVSLADSPFAGAINPETSLVSSGVIISTTPPNTVSPNPCHTIDNHHTPQPQPQTPSTSICDTTDGRTNGPVPTIAPIVEQFETPVTPTFTKEQPSAIVAAPIAPIVEHFEASSQLIEKTDNPQTVEASDETLTAPVTEQSEGSIVEGKPIESSTRGSNDTPLDAKANSIDNNQKSSNTGSEPVERGIPTGNSIPAGVPTVSYPEQRNATDEAALQTLSNSHKDAQSMLTATDEFTPVSVVDEVGQITDHVGQANGSNEKASETNTTNTFVVIAPHVGESEATGTSLSRDIGQNSQSLANAPHGETNTAEEDTEPLQKRIVVGDLPENASAERTQRESEVHAGHTNHETVDVAEALVRPGEEDESQLSSDDGKNIQCEVKNSAVMKPTTANIAAAASSQTDGEAGAPSTPAFTSNTSCGEIDTSENPTLNASAVQENLNVAMLSSGANFNSNEETLSASVGETSTTEKEGQSNNDMGKAINIRKTSESDIHVGPAIDFAKNDESRVDDTETLVRDAGVSGREQKVSYEYKENCDFPQTSGSSLDSDKSSRNVLGTISREPANPDASHERNSPRVVAKAKSCELQEVVAEEVVTEARKCEEDGRLEESTTGAQNSEQLSQKGIGATDTENGTAIGTDDTATSSIQREASTQTVRKGHHGTNEQETLEVMAAKALLARDKLAKFSLGSPVKKPHRGPFIRMTGDTRESSVKAAGTVPVSQGIRRSPTGPVPKKSSFSRTELPTTSDTSPISAVLETSFNSPKQGKLRSPSASSRGTDSVLTGLPPRRSPTQKGRSPSPRPKNAIGYSRSANEQKRNALQSEQHSPSKLSQPSSDNISRLPRVAGLTLTRSGSSRSPRSTPTKLRTRTRIPKAATFSATVPRSKPMVSSPVLGRKVGIASSPVTPSSSEKASNTRRTPLRRALSFMPSSARFSPLSRPMSSRSGGSDSGSTLSLSASGSKPPRGGRPRFTVPEPFALAGPELQERSEKQMEEVRRKAAEADLRPRVFKPRPMPDFSRPYPKPHK